MAKQAVFDECKDCYGCMHFNRDLTGTGIMPPEDYRPNFCDKFQADVPEEFRDQGCSEWDNIPF